MLLCFPQKTLLRVVLPFPIESPKMINSILNHRSYCQYILRTKQYDFHGSKVCHNSPFSYPKTANSSLQIGLSISLTSSQRLPPSRPVLPNSATPLIIHGHIPHWKNTTAISFEFPIAVLLAKTWRGPERSGELGGVVSRKTLQTTSAFWTLMTFQGGGEGGCESALIMGRNDM